MAKIRKKTIKFISAVLVILLFSITLTNNLFGIKEVFKTNTDLSVIIVLVISMLLYSLIGKK